MNKKEKGKYYKTTLMKEIDKKQLPKDFKKWIDSNIFKRSFRMFIKKISSKKYLGSCQCCKVSNIDLRKVKIGQKIKCPNCKQYVSVKNEKYNKFCDKDFAYLIQKCSVGYVMRLFMIFRQSEGVNYNYNIHEVERCFIEFEPGFKHRWFHINNYGEWLNNRYKNMWYEYPYKNWTYTRNLFIIKKEKGFQFAPFKEYCRLMGEYSNILLFLSGYIKYTCLEKFVKCKMSNFVDYTLCEYGSKPLMFNWSANNLRDVLMLKSQTSLKYAIKNNATKEDILALRILETENKSITNENLFTAHYISSLIKEAYSYFGFEGFKKYFIKSLEEDLYDFISDYNDYFINCLKLKRDMRNTKWLKPYDFRMAHDLAYDLVQSMENKNLDNKVKKTLKQYFKLKYEDDKYCVIIPKTANDIRKEGKDNANCVGSYVNRVAQGDSIICFIRHIDEPKKSFYTVEVDPKDFKIIQCRGYNNKKTSEEKQVQNFANQWQKKVLNNFKRNVC